MWCGRGRDGQMNGHVRPMTAATVRGHFLARGPFCRVRACGAGTGRSHGLSDVNWAAIAFGLAESDHIARLWPQLMNDTGFWVGEMPTQIVTRPFTYEPGNCTSRCPFPVMSPLHDIAAMGRVWYLEALACQRAIGSGPPADVAASRVPRCIGRRLLARTLPSATRWLGHSGRRGEVLRVPGSAGAGRLCEPRVAERRVLIPVPQHQYCRWMIWKRLIQIGQHAPRQDRADPLRWVTLAIRPRSLGIKPTVEVGGDEASGKPRWSSTCSPTRSSRTKPGPDGPDVLYFGPACMAGDDV